MDGLNSMASQQGLESYLQGVVGSGVVTAPSTINRALNGEKQSLQLINNKNI